MIIEEFLQNEGKTALLQKAIGELISINAFGVFLEVGANRSIPTPSDQPTETAALRAAWHDGYVESLRDIFYFFERYIKPAQSTARRDFGAADAMLQAGDITKEEYNELTGTAKE